jgi:hypothetical protein
MRNDRMRRSREPRRHVFAYAYGYESPQPQQMARSRRGAMVMALSTQSQHSQAAKGKHPRQMRWRRTCCHNTTTGLTYRHKFGRVARVASVAMERGSCEAMLAATSPFARITHIDHRIDPVISV